MAEKFLPVRLSHLLRHCSVGAIVRGEDILVVVRDIRDWYGKGEDPREHEIRYVEQVRSALGISEALCRPPVKRERDGNIAGWIRAQRFPSWMRCLRCGMMHRAPWRGDTEATNEFDELRCVACGGKLEQLPWVLAHESGYLADAPWHDLAHATSRNPNAMQCRPDWQEPYLKYEEGDSGRRIRCTREGCGASGDIESRWPFGAKTWQQPWVREPPPEPPNEPAWLLEINDVRVHSADNRTALVIPPESRIRRGTVVDRLYGNSKDQQRIRRARSRLAREGTIRTIASIYGCRPKDIEAAMGKIDSGYPLYGHAITHQDLSVGEYRALTEPIPDLKEDEDFVTEHQTPAWKDLARSLEDGFPRRVAAAVSRLVAVDKLKEIMVLTGFRRANGETPTPPDITGESDWRPAIELYGEGLFFTLDESLLRRWEANRAVAERTTAFEQRYPSAPLRTDVEITSRFLLCHTLAHLMIRQIEATAGYPAASLKERIYCSNGAEPMAGVLIYVAVPDEQGSLGGVMELAAPDRFLRLLTAAFDAAQWCSLDPVCGEQEGHGPGLLNRAACHACALIPETSCAYENVLLDRAYVKGDPGMPSLLEV